MTAIVSKNYQRVVIPLNYVLTSSIPSFYFRSFGKKFQIAKNFFKVSTFPPQIPIQLFVNYLFIG